MNKGGKFLKKLWCCVSSFSLFSRKSEVVDCFCKLLAHFSSSRYRKDYKFDGNGKED